jgi:hypothetical protein
MSAATVQLRAAASAHRLYSVAVAAFVPRACSGKPLIEYFQPLMACAKRQSGRE